MNGTNVDRWNGPSGAILPFCCPQCLTPPKIFLTRIKRLLDVDRTRDTSQDSEIPHARFAFYDDTPGGQGTDVSYTLLNTAFLALGLELLDVGFKQGEIVFVLRHLKKEFTEQFSYILKNPPIPRQRVFSTGRPNCPWYTEKKDGPKFADCRVYAVIKKVEFTEVFPLLKGRVSPRQPLFLPPAFCHGIQALHKELHQMNLKNYHYRKAFVMEISHTVVLVKEFLRDAPSVRRGPK